MRTGTHHVFAGGDKDDGFGELGEDAHVHAGVGDDLSFDAKARLDLLELRVRELATDVEVASGDGDRCVL